MKFSCVSEPYDTFQETVKRLSKRDDEEINPLAPYLARVGNPAYISRAEAYLLRDDCLNDFKQWSVDKANHILRTIEERATELEKMQALLTQVIIPIRLNYSRVFLIC